VSRTTTKPFCSLAAAGFIGAALAYSPMSQAFNFGDMMNPGKWMGGGDDRYDDYYEDGPYGGPWGGGPYGYGGPWGGGPWGGGPYGYGAGPGGGYGYPGAYGAPRTAAPAQAPAAKSAPAASSSSNVKDAEIEALKRRIDELETKQAAPVPPPSDWSDQSGDWGKPSTPSDWGAAPAFRPRGKN